MPKHTLGTLSLTDKDLDSVKSVVASNWLSPGPHVKAFEQAFSKRHQQSYGVMVNSGTDALRIALAALKERYRWKDGDTVLVPAITFVATVNVVLQLNLIPRLVDVSMYDFNINPDNLAHIYQTSEVKAKCLIPVHLAGKPCDMSSLLDLASKHKLRVLEDSCETMGVPGIARGDITAFSFYVAHLLTTGVGGMATTNDKDLKELMWSYSNHGRRELKKFQFDRIGYSCRPTEFEAALGLNQLPLLGDIIAKRRRNARYLFENLCDLRGLHLTYSPDSSCMFFPVLIDKESGIPKAAFMNHLEKRGIESRELMPITNQPCYKHIFKEYDYPVAREVNASAFYIGCHQDMTLSDLDEIIDAFSVFLWSKTNSPSRRLDKIAV